MPGPVANFEHLTPRGPRRGGSSWRPEWVSRREALAGVLTLLGTAATSWRALAEAPTFEEHEIKAGFLFNFAGFTEWPSTKVAAADHPVIIGVHGSPPLAESLLGIAKRKTTVTPKREIRILNATAEARDCHLVFLGGTKISASTLTELKEARVLTVGDARDFVDKGGMIQFLTLGENVRFDVNLPIVEDAGIRISSRVLRLAHEVRPRGRVP